MKNKRYLKKRIQQICGQAAVEVLLGLPSEIAHPIVIRLAELQSRSLARVSFRFDRNKAAFSDPRAYTKARSACVRAAYATLQKDFKDQIADIVSQINTSLPRS